MVVSTNVQLMMTLMNIICDQYILHVSIPTSIIRHYISTYSTSVRQHTKFITLSVYAAFQYKSYISTFFIIIRLYIFYNNMLVHMSVNKKIFFKIAANVSHKNI